MLNKHTAKALVLSLIVLNFLSVKSQNPYIISDDRVRSLDLSPVLGRGYSVMTNTFQSTCLVVDQTTVPSYNYDCESNIFFVFKPFLTSQWSNFVHEMSRI